MTAPVRDLATAVLVIALLAPALPTEAATVTHQAPSFVQVAPGIRIHVVRAGPASGARAPLIAIVRGGIQLAFVGLALRGVLNAPSTVAIALVVMLSAASWTAGWICCAIVAASDDCQAAQAERIE